MELGGFGDNKCGNGKVSVVDGLSVVENMADGLDGDLFERKKTLGEERPKDDNSNLGSVGKLVGFGTDC